MGDDQFEQLNHLSSNQSTVGSDETEEVMVGLGFGLGLGLGAVLRFLPSRLNHR